MESPTWGAMVFECANQRSSTCGRDDAGSLMPNLPEKKKKFKKVGRGLEIPEQDPAITLGKCFGMAKDHSRLYAALSSS